MAIFTTLRGEIHNSISYKLRNSMEVDSVVISKNIDKCGKNPQSACRKPNYHTKCGKNCHKILSVYSATSCCHFFCSFLSYSYKKYNTKPFALLFYSPEISKFC